MNPKYDLTGRTFYQLTVVGRSQEVTSKGRRFWECRCTCGKTTHVETANLNGGGTKSCGCRKIEATRSTGLQKKHGLTGTVEYKAWSSMRERCYKTTSANYKNYGARGITVCDRWRSSFLYFYQDMGKRPGPEYSLDREDNDGNYEPGNCRWATPTEQSNNRRTNVFHLVNEHAITLSQLAREIDVPVATLDARLRRGLTLEEAVVKKASKQLFTHNGETKNVAEWAACYGMPYSKLYFRLVRNGWSFERSIEEYAK